MSSSEILERERSRALPTALATFAGVAMLIVALAVGQGGTSGSESQVLTDFPEDREDLLVAAILQAAGMTLLVAPLFYLFQAASARSEQMRHALIGITIAGPLFLAVAFILEWVAFDQAASVFAEPGGGAGIPVGEYAEDLIRDEATFNAAQGFSFAGTLGLVVGVVYTSLHAMRVGLLTRFWGTLGMALGVSLLFLGLLGVLVFFLAIGLLIAGWWPGDRPPAWDEGRAVPWPAPGDRAEAEDSDRPAEPDEFTRTVEGTGSEVSSGEPAVSSGSGASRSRRKRKRRG